MSVVRVAPTRQLVTRRGRHRTATRVRVDGVARPLWFSTRGDVPFLDRNRGDVWFPPLLLLAMRRGERLVLKDPVSAELRASMEQVQDVMIGWYPDRFSRVEVTAPPPEPSAPARSGLLRRRTPDERVAATCFTAGVDSFFSLVDHRDEIGALVYAFGLDVPLHMTEATRRVRLQLAAVAGESGTRLLTTRTNIRTFLGSQVSWGFESHGAVLASIGALFSPVVSRLYIPSTHPAQADVPWGSHHRTDPLWSTARLDVVHQAPEVSRAGKVARLADDPIAQGHLRVCFKQFATTNCCRCMKCMRTMATLTLLDRLQKFDTFPEPLDLDHLAAQRLTTTNDLVQMSDLLALAERTPGHDDLRAVLAGLVGDYRERLAAGHEGWRPGQPPPGA